MMAGVKLPVMPPVGPMLAKSVKAIPTGDYLYEPKWDGFRCIAFRDGDEVELASRGEKPLTRYFPEVVEALKANLPDRCVVDGEVVIVTGDRLDFEALLQRIHPAKSRVDRLAAETPASFVAFDLLAVDDESLLDDAVRRATRPARAGAGRRRRRRCSSPRRPTTPRSPQQWFEVFEGAGLDGVIAKPTGGALPARRPRDGQDQARAHGRLRRRRLPLAQVRRGRGLAAARPLRRRRPPAARRRLGVVPDEAPGRAGRGARAVRRRGRVRPPLGRLGRGRGAREGPAARRGQPVERQEGPVLGAAATRPGRRGGVRPHGGHPVPAHRPVASAGGRTASRSPAPTSSSTAPYASTWPRSSARHPDRRCRRRRDPKDPVYTILLLTETPSPTTTSGASPSCTAPRRSRCTCWSRPTPSTTG